MDREDCLYYDKICKCCSLSPNYYCGICDKYKHFSNGAKPWIVLPLIFIFVFWKYILGFLGIGLAILIILFAIKSSQE